MKGVSVRLGVRERQGLRQGTEKQVANMESFEIPSKTGLPLRKEPCIEEKLLKWN